MLSSLRALRELAGRHREEYDIESPPSHRHSCPAAVERPAEASRRTLSRSASFRKRNSQPQATRSRSPFSRAGSTRSQSRSPFSRTGSRPGSGSSSASLSASANRPGSADLSSGDESDEHNADQLPGLFEAEGLYGFEAESAAELAFSAGQRLRIFPDVPCEPGWWLAELHGRQGLVPCAYVRSRQASRPQTPEALPRTVIRNLWLSRKRPLPRIPATPKKHPARPTNTGPPPCPHHTTTTAPLPTLRRRATHTSRWARHRATPGPTHTAPARAPAPPPARWPRPVSQASEALVVSPAFDPLPPP
jgi:hypothetical protein